MKAKVFCIGTLKTGTTSLGRALSILGYRHTGYNADLLEELKRGNTQSLLDFANDYDAFDDWPWAVGDLYVELDQAFPGSKFIYSDRDLISWARSYFRYFYSDLDWEGGRPRDFEEEFPEKIVERRDRKRRILRYFAERPGDVLVINLMRGEGWEELCQFLGLPIPQEAFPHANKTKDG